MNGVRLIALLGLITTAARIGEIGQNDPLTFHNGATVLLTSRSAFMTSYP